MYSSLKILKIIILTIFIIFLSTGCSNSNTPKITATNTVEAYPRPEENNQNQLSDFESGYPISTSQISNENLLPDTISIPTPNDESGVITGQLIKDSDKAPYIAPGLYLGGFLEPNEDMENAPSIYGISPGVDPQAEQGKDVSFVFSDVEPGKYILLIWSPMSILPVKDVETQEEIILIIEAGEEINLGTIYIE